MAGGSIRGRGYLRGAESHDAADLHLHQHQCRFGRLAYRSGHAPYLHVAGQRDRRRGADPRIWRLISPATQKDKTISYWSALVRSSATRNGHNPDIGEAFMDKEKEVKIGDRVVHPKGTLLTLNAQEATRDRSTANRCSPTGLADSVT